MLDLWILIDAFVAFTGENNMNKFEIGQRVRIADNENSRVRGYDLYNLIGKEFVADLLYHDGEYARFIVDGDVWYINAKTCEPVEETTNKTPTKELYVIWDNINKDYACHMTRGGALPLMFEDRHQAEHHISEVRKLRHDVSASIKRWTIIEEDV